MRIVFVGNHGVSFSSENHHCKSLESLGHQVTRLQEGRVTTGQIWRHCMSADLLVWVHTHSWHTQEDTMTVQQLFERLRASGKTSLTYHLDLWLGLERQKDLENDPFYKSIEYFFTVDRLMADWFNENTGVKGVFMPPGVFDQECYIHPDYDGTFDNDIIFVGSRGYHHEWPYRPQLIDWLKETYGDRFKHYGGDGLGVVREDALNRLYARTKIAVGDSLNIGFKYPYYSSDRLWEGAGRFAFQIYPDIDGLSDHFESSTEMVYYRHVDFNDLKSNIDYYLEHDDDREEIRRNSHERCKRDGTYIHRWRSILEIIRVGS